MTHTGNVVVVDLRQQTMDNCAFMTDEDTNLDVIISKAPESGKFRAMVVKTEGYGHSKKRSVFFSDVGVTVAEAIELLHTKSAEALNQHIMTNGFAPVRGKGRKPRDWDDDRSDATASSSGSDSEDSDDSRSSSTVSEDERPFGKSKKKNAKKHCSSSRHRNDDNEDDDVAAVLGPARWPGPVRPSGRPPPPPPGRFSNAVPPATTPGQMPQRPLARFPRQRGPTGPGVPPPPRMRPLSGVMPPGMHFTMPCPPVVNSGVHLPPHSSPISEKGVLVPSTPTAQSPGPAGDRSRDVRIGITWAGHRQQIMVRCAPSRRSITAAASRYFNGHLNVWGVEKSHTFMTTGCMLKEIVLHKGSTEERYDLTAYYLDDLSDMCDSATGTTNSFPLFEVTMMHAEPSNNGHSENDW